MIELNARISSALSSVRLVHSISMKYRESVMRMFHVTSEQISLLFLNGESIHDDGDGDGGDDARRTRTLFGGGGGGGAAKTGSLSLPLILVDRCCRDTIILSRRRRVWSGGQLGSFECSSFAF